MKPIFTLPYKAETLGEQVMLLRHRLGISQGELSELSGVPAYTIRRIEYSDAETRHLTRTVTAIFKALGFEVDRSLVNAAGAILSSASSAPAEIRLVDLLRAYGFDLVTIEELAEEARQQT